MYYKIPVRVLGIVILLLTGMIGCNNKQELSGKISFPDGKPLDRGMVYFCTDTYVARGTIRPDGTFDVGSLGDRDGLPPGKYKVYLQMCDIEEEVASPESSGKTMPRIRSLVDPKYCQAETTPLSYEQPGSKTYDFVVEPPKQKK